MNDPWQDDDLTEQFTLLPPEISFLGSNDPHNQLGKALLLKFFQQEARFPEDINELPPVIVAYVAQQLGVPAEAVDAYNWNGSRIKEHRREIRALLGFRPATLADQKTIQTWLENEVLPHEHRPIHLEQLVYQRLRQTYLEPPSKKQLDRLIRAARHRHEQAFFEQTNRRLSETVKAKLQALIYKKESREEAAAVADEEELISYPIHELKAGTGAANVKNMKAVASRLKQLQTIGLPSDLFQGIPLRFLKQYRQQTAVASISHLQRREKNRAERPQTYTMLAAFCWVRQREITDQLVDLFIRVLKDIRLRAEHREERQLLADFIRVGGKQRLLFQLAEAMLENPDGIIRDILYPVVGQERLQSLVKEAQTKGTYHVAVQTRINASYTHHYRQILPPLLEVLTFRSNNTQYKPLLAALKVVTAYLGEKDPFYPPEQKVQLDDVVQKQWQSWIYQQDKNGKQRIRRVRYELCVLQSLRDKLRCKEIWVEGAARYRNPAEDVPADFNLKRDDYYQALKLPLKAEDFVQQVKTEIEKALQQLNDTLEENTAVELLPKAGGWIRLSPLPKQTEPLHLRTLKNHVKQQWWMTRAIAYRTLPKGGDGLGSKKNGEKEHVQQDNQQH